MKIAIIGYGGSGKSTLARILGRQYQILVLHMDQVNFIENWKQRPKEQSYKIVYDFMTQPSCIIEGNYQQYCFKERMQEASIIIMKFSVICCLK